MQDSAETKSRVDSIGAQRIEQSKQEDRVTILDKYMIDKDDMERF
jgi:hypothetical protein